MEFDPHKDLLEARADVESLMLDACTVGRPGAVATDPDSGAVTRPLTPIYAGKCRLRQVASQPRESVAGEHEHTVQETRWDTPVGSGPFAIGDIVTMTEAALDAQLIGRTYRVTGLFNQSAATAQRCKVEEILT
jgi:hypothetical protein